MARAGVPGVDASGPFTAAALFTGRWALEHLGLFRLAPVVGARHGAAVYTVISAVD